MNSFHRYSFKGLNKSLQLRSSWRRRFQRARQDSSSCSNDVKSVSAGSTSRSRKSSVSTNTHSRPVSKSQFIPNTIYWILFAKDYNYVIKSNIKNTQRKNVCCLVSLVKIKYLMLSIVVY